ncbi:MAG: D-glycero-beta-D-manno-heptose-7-phosphate kinase [Chitinivorax sp.]
MNPEELKSLQQAIAKARILVVGDVMLDRYWFGDVNRISPEAPVPVALVSRVEERAGGAANVARNAASLGCGVTLLSVIGDDEAGTVLDSLMHSSGVKSEMLRDPTIATIVKLRVIAKQQQLLRIDFEAPPSHEILAAKLDDYRRALPEHDLIILSDYGKGGLTHVQQMIELATKAGKPVLIDPKGDDYSRYRGASLLTPNRAEFRQVAGSWRSEQELAEKADKLRTELSLQALLVTRSEEGMSLYRDGQPFHQPTQAREVFDVSGAGDTVIATLGVMLAAGQDMAAAVSWSNKAAGVVVAKLGTAVVQPEELFA